MKVYFGNLPRDIDDAKLGEIVKPYGVATSAEVVKDRVTGASKGFAFVEFGSEAEAQATITALTTAGRVLFDFAQQMLNLRHHAHSAIRELRDLHRGKLSLGANEYTVMSLLPLIPLFRARHPHIRIEIKRSLASRITSEIIGRDVEIGVITFKPSDTAIRSLPLASDEIALVVAPNHPLATKHIVSVRELGAEAFVAHNVRSPYREKVIKTFQKHRTPLNISMEMPTLEAIKRLVEQGMGVALMPRLAAQTEIERNQLVGLQVREMKLERRLHLIYRKNATLSHAAKAFLRIARGAEKNGSAN